MDSLLERARRDGTPVIADNQATFVWEGTSPPRLAGDFNGWGHEADTRPMEQIAPGAWARTIELPPDSYIEYALELPDGRVPDPLNPRSITNGVGGRHSYFAMPEFGKSPLLQVPADGYAGTLTEHVVHDPWHLADGERVVRLYHPAVDGPFPLLMVLDGQDYGKRAALPTIVDNLIAQERIRPIAMAMIDHGGAARSVEYNCNDATVNLLERSIAPLAHEHLHLIDPRSQPGAWGMLGASLGGLMALYSAVRRPERFGSVLSQSGAWGHDSAQRVITDMIRYFPAPQLKIWMDVGRYEGLLAENRRMRALLLQTGYDVGYHEYNGAHNYTSWKNDVWRGLESVFPVDS